MGIWVRSYFTAEVIARESDWTKTTPQPLVVRVRMYWIAWPRGTIAIERTSGESDLAMPTISRWHYDRAQPLENLVETGSADDRMNLRFGQFQLNHRAESWAGGWSAHQRVVLPLWAFVIFAIPPLLWLRRYRRYRGRGFPVEVAVARAD